MPAHDTALELHSSYLQVADPGASGTITIDRNLAYVPLVSATSETRTLARPTVEGVRCTLAMKTDGGDIVVTVTGGFNEVGDTTFTFSDAGQFADFVSVEYGGAFYWRLVSHYALGDLSPTEAATVNSQTLSVTAGAGITGGTGTIYQTSLRTVGGIKTAVIMLDLTGLASSTTDLDIIGVSTTPAYIGQILAAEVGTVLTVAMTCLEAPAGGVTDIDLYSADEATGKFDDAISGLVETALITSGGAWTNGATKGATTVPAANQYLYLTGGAGGTAATYTAGKFLIEISGY